MDQIGLMRVVDNDLVLGTGGEKGTSIKRWGTTKEPKPRDTADNLLTDLDAGWLMNIQSQQVWNSNRHWVSSMYQDLRNIYFQSKRTWYSLINHIWAALAVQWFSLLSSPKNIPMPLDCWQSPSQSWNPITSRMFNMKIFSIICKKLRSCVLEKSQKVRVDRAEPPRPGFTCLHSWYPSLSQFLYDLVDQQALNSQ